MAERFAVGGCELGTSQYLAQVMRQSVPTKIATNEVKALEVLEVSDAYGRSGE